jgi:hypothetical protein
MLRSANDSRSLQFALILVGFGMLEFSSMIRDLKSVTLQGLESVRHPFATSSMITLLRLMIASTAFAYHVYVQILTATLPLRAEP